MTISFGSELTPAELWDIHRRSASWSSRTDYRVPGRTMGRSSRISSALSAVIKAQCARRWRCARDGWRRLAAIDEAEAETTAMALLRHKGTEYGTRACSAAMLLPRRARDQVAKASSRAPMGTNTQRSVVNEWNACPRRRGPLRVRPPPHSSSSFGDVDPDIDHPGADASTSPTAFRGGSRLLFD